MTSGYPFCFSLLHKRSLWVVCECNGVCGPGTKGNSGFVEVTDCNTVSMLLQPRRCHWYR